MLLSLVVACTTPSGDGSPPAAARPDGVRALRYRLEVVDSTLDAIHGGGRDVDELFFPDHGVACEILWKSLPERRGDELEWSHHGLRVFRATEDRLANGRDVTEVVVPREVALRIVEIADEEDRLARELIGSGLLQAEPTHAQRFDRGASDSR